MQLADYSAARLTGAQLRATGYGGSIRYFGTPGRAKNATAAEVRSQLAAGLHVLGVYENSTTDWTAGHRGGATAARALLADANACGVPQTSPLGVAADRHLTASQLKPWRQYVLGARSVLGARTMVYGFSEAIAAVADLGVFLWQCGSFSAVNPRTHLWQNNNTTRRVAGINCDINEVLKPLTVAAPARVQHVNPAEETMQYIACQGLNNANSKAVSVAYRMESGDFVGLSAGAAQAVFDAEKEGRLHVDWVTPADWAEFDRLSTLRRAAFQALVDMAAAGKVAA